MLQWLRNKAEQFTRSLQARTVFEKKILLILKEADWPIRVGQIHERLYINTGIDHSISRLHYWLERLADEELVNQFLRSNLREGIKTMKPHFSITPQGERAIENLTWERLR